MKYCVILFLIGFAAITIVQFSMIPVYAHHDDDTSRGSNDPKITVNGNDVYVVWLESNSSQFGNVYFVKITDGKTVEELMNITH